MNILKKLEDARVFSVQKEGESYSFSEQCDYHFGINLSKEEVLQLIEELKTLLEVKKT